MRIPTLLLLVACARQAPVPGYTIGGDGLPVVSDDPEATLPFDPRVHKGVLDNGLTWYVEPNARPAGRAEIRLVVKVGSVLEEDDERGVAHYLEHLAFNGTENFPGRSLVAWIEGLGMRFGADINAFTGFDETVFVLQVPTDDPANLDTALRVLRDWGTGITFDDEECARERGVVLEEWRLSGGFEQRIQDATMPSMFAGSRYVERRPIGGEQAIQALDCDKAESFYDRWYRPDLMGVIVVGDVDPETTETRIAEVLGTLPAPAPDAPERPRYTVPGHDDIKVVPVTDPELTAELVTILHKTDEVESDTHAAYRRFLVEQLAFIVLGERLGLRATDPTSPFRFAGGMESQLGLERVSHTLQAAVKPGRMMDALRELLVARRTLKVHGVLSSEVERARRALSTNMDAYYAERDKTDTTTHAEELQRNFLEDEPVPGIPYEFALAKTMLPTLDVAAVSSFIASDVFMPADGRVVQLMGPEGTDLPDVEAVRALVVEVDDLVPEPTREVEGAVRLVEPPGAPGIVERIASDSSLGTKTITLANGVTVVILPTTLQEDEVVVSGFAPGGTSTLPEPLFLSGLLADAVARASGVGELNSAEVARLLAGRGFSASVGLDDEAEIVVGQSNREEWPTMLEYLYAQITAPRFDPAVFAEVMAAQREQVARRGATPESRFELAWQRLLWQDHPNRRAWSLEELDAVGLDAMEQAWSMRFDDLSDLTLVVVGNITAEDAIDGLLTWVGNLPGDGEVEEPADDGARRRPGPYAGWMVDDGTNANVRLQFHAPWSDDMSDRLILDGLGALLEARLHEELREELGGTYGVGVSEGIDTTPESVAVLTVEFSCDPERLPELLEAMEAVIDETRETEWPDVVVASFREKNIRTRETSMQSNGWWAGAVAGHIRRGDDPAALLDFDRWNAAVTGPAIREAAQALLRPAHRVELVQSPDTPPPDGTWQLVQP